MIIIVVVAINQVSEPPSTEPEASALRINLDGQIVEQRQRLNPMTELSNELVGNPQEKEIDLQRLVDTIDAAATDNNITGIILSLDQLPPTSQTKLAIIGQALERFKSSNKPILSYADYYDQHQYYLASFADELLLNPKGAVLMRGINSRRLFYKDVIDKLDVSTHVFRVGTHKSFVEPYIRNDMSPEAKQDLAHWMDQLWQGYLITVAQNRKLDAQQLVPEPKRLIQRLTTVEGDSALYAERFGLVDQLVTRDQAKQYFVEQFGEADNKLGYHYLSYQDYAQSRTLSHSEANDNKIALLVAQGPIVSGEGEEKVIAADTVLRQLDQALQDDQVKALVMRVDSPGGSAFASELIRNKLQQFQTKGIPVVVSMGSVAASGGYWISASADQIFASPTTITGSIGIFGMFATIENALAKLGVHSDGYATTTLAELSPFQALPEELKQLIQLNIEHGYHDFLNLVSEGRGIEIAKLDKLAQGRIWTGKDALANGLIDQLGDLNDAIAYAANMSELQDYQIDRLTVPLNPREQFIAQLFDSQISRSLEALIPHWRLLKALSEQAPALEMFNDPLGQYSYCAICEQL